MHTIFGEFFTMRGTDFPATSGDFEFAKKFMTLTETLLAGVKLKTHSEVIGLNSLKGAVEGLGELKAGKISGQKLVYRVAETL
jgi:hypothetical protein